ncbi:MAG: MBL fold metallo-hydrolase [Oscillospiraceae bacterium]|nr:MBL fold metallo-hydrolase [Oscillospiraceae bacterium]
MRIHAIEYAQSRLPESMVLAGGNSNKQLDISFLLYVVEIEHRRILIDAGCDSLPGFEMKNFISPAKALSDYGILPEQITDVIITHAHHDHIDGLHHFPQARIHIQSDEYLKGAHYIPITARVHIFEESCVVAKHIQILHIGGHTSGSCIAKVQVGNMQYIFGGDECYLPICLEQNIPTGASHDPDASKAFIDRFCRPGYRVLLTHDTQIHTGIIIERT